MLTAPAVPQRAPRVLGVDEFAFRKGRRYGTVLADVQAARVVDVLPDRDAATFTAWLREHPGAEIICRDRASAYSSAIREAAPDAQEIADRWHLLNNLSSAVEKTCHQHRSCLRKQAEAERIRCLGGSSTRCHRRLRRRRGSLPAPVTGTRTSTACSTRGTPSPPLPAVCTWTVRPCDASATPTPTSTSTSCWPRPGMGVPRECWNRSPRTSPSGSRTA
ncbi:transposase [Streptomyces olivochromogenes]|uniref:transposase n=1 Tax=Streptomyces olivochromogenes TaxID=1963 RepID=UPI0036CBC7B3